MAGKIRYGLRDIRRWAMLDNEARTREMLKESCVHHSNRSPRVQLSLLLKSSKICHTDTIKTLDISETLNIRSLKCSEYSWVPADPVSPLSNQIFEYHIQFNIWISYSRYRKFISLIPNRVSSTKDRKSLEIQMNRLHLYLLQNKIHLILYVLTLQLNVLNVNNN